MTDRSVIASLPLVARNDGILRVCILLIAAVTSTCSTAWADYQPKGKRDPFVPLLLPDGRRIAPPVEEDAVSSGLGNMVLQGIIFDPRGHSAAILNGHVLRENEEWSGIKLLKIEADGVTIWKDGETRQMIFQKPDKENKSE